MPFEILHHALNVGVVDAKNLHRVDLAKMRLAAEDQTNIIPDITGRGFFRPGTKYISATKSNAKAKLISFIAGSSDAYVLEMTAGFMRVINGDDDTYITRAAVTSVVTNGDFSSSVGWTLASSAGQTSSITGGKLELSARAHGGRASCARTMTVVETGVIHALRIIVDRGPVTFRLGSTSGGDELINETVLRTGEHSLAFTPSGASAFIEFSSQTQYKVIVDSITVESAGVISLPTPWDADEIWSMQTTQSLDVMYVASAGNKQRRIERRGGGTSAGLSWSVCDYDVDDGPFYPIRSIASTLTPSALEGDINITSSVPYWTANHVGALIKMFHESQNIDTYLAAKGEYTPTFMITGITETNFEERKYAYTIAGTWVGTLRNERSFDGEDVEFHPYRREQASATVDITANATYTNDDNDDNSIVWVRIGFKSYTSGEAHITLTYDGGGGYGIARITGITSSTVATAQVLRSFKSIDPTKYWQEGQWSLSSGYPAGVGFYNGRLCWAGNDAFWGSVSDAYESFDEDFDGDAGPLLRALAVGGRNEARWIMPLETLVVGCDSRVANIRASSLDEVLTPSNFGVHQLDKVPAASIPPVELKNNRGLFVADSRTSLYELNYSNEAARYLATKFSLLTDDLFASGITSAAATNFPDQRVWVTNDEADATLILYEPLMDIIAAIPIATATGDVIESITVIPGVTQDRVYMSVKRTVNSATVRYVEKLALDSEALPGDITYCMDSYVTGGADANGVITGLTHLEGRTVVAWVDGAPIDTLEPSDTTLLTTAAHETDNTLWSHGFTTVSAGFSDPDGGSTAERVLETADNGNHDTGVALIDFAVGSHQVTMTIKSIGGRDVQLGLFDNGFGSGLIYRIDQFGALQVGSYGAVFTATDTEVTPLGNGWYTVTVDFAVNSAVTDGHYFINCYNGASSYAGDITKGFYFHEATLRRTTNTSGTTKTFTVTGGQVTLDNPVVTGYCIGLPYRGRYKSARLAYGGEGQSPFMKNKALAGVGMILADCCRSGVKFGGFFDDADHPLTSLPVYGSRGRAAAEVVNGPLEDEQMNSVTGDLSFDPRLCIEFNSPKPASILSIVMNVEARE